MKISLLFILLLTSTLVSAETDLTSALEALKIKHNLPGLTAAYFQDGKEIESAAVGVRKSGSPETIKTTDKFHIGSCSKAMTATLAATFVEEGKLSWKSTLAELLPEIKLHPQFQEVTFDMLLAHRSGLITDQAEDFYIELSKLEISAARKLLTETLLQSAPPHAGTFKYSNMGYIVAGYILEKISGKSWEMLMNERIFSPLGMNSCGFGATSDPESDIPLQPWGHYLEDGKFHPVHADNSPFYGPAATVHCSINDWSKFLDIHIQGFNGIKSILTVESFKKLHTPYPEEGETYTYGAWIRLNQGWSKGPLFTHTGSNVFNVASVWLAPAEKSILISTANIGGKPAKDANNDAIIELIIRHMQK